MDSQNILFQLISYPDLRPIGASSVGSRGIHNILRNNTHTIMLDSRFLKKDNITTTLKIYVFKYVNSRAGGLLAILGLGRAERAHI